MTSERRYLWVASGAVALIALGLFLLPRLREEFAPEPQSALVAVEIEGSGIGQVGRVRIDSGQRFVLHAVLVAADRQAEPVYYTQAPALRIGGEEVDPSRLRSWDRAGETVVLWFTVEGFRPFMELETVEELDGFRWEESFRPEWGRGWTISGSVTPRNNALARGFEADQEIPFGTARYHVRIERYFRRGDPVPLARYRSPGAGQVSDAERGPTTVQAALSGGLRRVSIVFGLSHLEPAATAPPGLQQRLAGWYEDGLAFSRLLVLDGLLQDHHLTWSELGWSSVDLALKPTWETIGPGDLLRSGGRIVVLYADRGEEGRLDYDDLCFDLAESAAVRRLGEIFTGGGVLEWSDLDSEVGVEAEPL